MENMMELLGIFDERLKAVEKFTVDNPDAAKKWKLVLVPMET